MCSNLLKITTFAAAMQSENPLNINMAHAAEAAKRLNIELTDRFFADLEQEEISGGEVHVGLEVRASAEHIYNVQVTIRGIVEVQCDRCLDSLRLNVEVEDVLKVKDAEPEESDALEMLYTDAKTCTCDLAWEVYELIETSLPLVRVHADGECNKDMLSYIMTDEGADDDNNI